MTGGNRGTPGVKTCYFWMRAGLVLAAGLLAGACHPGTRFGEPTRRATFRGYGACAFEVASFLPCGTKTPYWLNCKTPGMEKALDVMEACELQSCSVAGVYLELDGDLSAEGRYGHFEMYKHELSPSHVYYANDIGPKECGWADPDEWVMALP